MSKVVHLSDDSHNKAKEFCKDNRLKMSDWVAALIDDAIANGNTEVARSTVPKKKPMRRVEENIMVPAWATGIRDAPARLKRVFELLPEIARFADRKALALSGGQQKLVALGRALMVGRQLILLDEPFEGIAPALAQRLVEVLHTIKGEGGLSILLSESDYTHSAGLIDRLFVIERGSVTERAS